MPAPTITAEPGNGSVIYYQPLAKETSASIDKCKIGIWLDITNNDADVISLKKAFITFPNDVNEYPIGDFFLDHLHLPFFFMVPAGTTNGLGMKGG